MLHHQTTADFLDDKKLPKSIRTWRAPEDQTKGENSVRTRRERPGGTKIKVMASFEIIPATTGSSNNSRQGVVNNYIQLLFFFVMSLMVWMTTCVSVVETKLVAATILPHGDVALDPTRLSPGTKAREAGEEIAMGAREAGKWFATSSSSSSSYNNDDVNYDLIFLSTPHGIQLTHDFGIYLGPKASGSINVTGDNSSSPSYTVTMPPITLDTALSLDLVIKLTSSPNNKSKRRGTGFNVSGIATSADGAHDMPLEWAEIIPLKFLPEPQRHSYKYIIWSYPLRRYTESPDMVPELLALGAAIREWMEGIPKLRMGVLISGDMSHTHEATGPYGYSNTSKPFDAVVGHWATNPCHNADSLLVRARSLQAHGAKSCGFTGMILLHGMLCGNDDNDSNKSPPPPYDPLSNDRVYVNRNATYYGMMAATFNDDYFPATSSSK